MHREHNIDILRIIASFMVLAVHTGFTVGIRHVAFGRYGLVVFFVMSGYLATLSYKSKEAMGKGVALTYYKKRLLRLIPEYYTILLISSVISNMGKEYVFPLRYFFFLQQFIPRDGVDFYDSIYLGSLSTFVFFYLLMPLFNKVVCNLKSAIVASSILCVMKPIMMYIMVNYLNCSIDYAEAFPVCNLYLFLIGMTIYYLKENNWKNVSEILAIYVLFIIVAEFEYDSMTFIIPILFAAFIVIKLEIKSNLIVKGIELLSKTSFNLYMLHGLVTGWVMYVVDDMSLRINKYVYFVIICVACIVVSILFTLMFNQLRSLCRRMIGNGQKR